MKKSSVTPFFLSALGTGLFAIAVITVQAQMRRQAFPDVTRDRSYSAAIERYARLGILQGYESGNFGPNESLKRSEMALIVQRLEEKMVWPLREQVEQMRKELNLGRCGDDILQTGEACDDGNTVDDDGCSAECLKETLFSSVPASNTSSSSVSSVAGNEPALSESSSSSQPEPEPQPQPQTKPPVCGDSICEDLEKSLPPDMRFYCPKDCTEAPKELVCRPLTTQALTLAEEDLVCQTREDCTVVEQSCPFISCGIPVNKAAYAYKVLEMRDAVTACKNEGMTADCVLCPYVSPYCENERCILKFNQR